MFGKIPHLRDSDFQELFAANESSQLFSHNSDPYPNKGGPIVTDYLSKEELSPLVSRSIKPKAGDFEISFQAGFMDEHLSALIYHSKNLVEHSLKNQDTIDFNLENENPFGEQAKKRPLNIMENELLAPQSRRQFIKDLENEEKLHKFLKKISEQFSAKISDELVFLSYIFWEKYIEIRKPFLSQKTLLSIALRESTELAQLLEKSGISFLNFRAFDSAELESEQKVQKNIEEFLQCFGSTIFLILEGYFQNPYIKENERMGKRERDNDDSLEWDEFYLCSNQVAEKPPTKKPKRK